MGGGDVIRYYLGLTLAVERPVSQASGQLWDEAWMRTRGERRLRSRLPSPPQPENEVNLNMNQETTSYQTNIAAKREPALLVYETEESIGFF